MVVKAISAGEMGPRSLWRSPDRPRTGADDFAGGGGVSAGGGGGGLGGDRAADIWPARHFCRDCWHALGGHARPHPHPRMPAPDAGRIAAAVAAARARQAKCLQVACLELDKLRMVRGPRKGLV